MITDFIIQAEKTEDARWFVFFTSWNYTACVVYFVAITIQNGIFVFKKKKSFSERLLNKEEYSSTGNLIDESTEDDDQLTGADKFVWLMFNITLPACFCVVVAFWSIIYGPNTNVTFFTVDRHGIDLVLILVDFSLHKIPVRVLHFVYPTTFLILYMIFSVIFSHATDFIIYSAVDWRKNPTKSTLLFLALIIASGVVHFIFYWIDRLLSLIHI